MIKYIKSQKFTYNNHGVYHYGTLTTRIVSSEISTVDNKGFYQYEFLHSVSE